MICSELQPDYYAFSFKKNRRYGLFIFVSEAERIAFVAYNSGLSSLTILSQSRVANDLCV